jgi:hypothetical protein
MIRRNRRRGCKRVIGTIGTILIIPRMRTADDLFGALQGRLRTDRIDLGAIPRAVGIMQRIDQGSLTGKGEHWVCVLRPGLSTGPRGFAQFV